jgi:hypothetical protein
MFVDVGEVIVSRLSKIKVCECLVVVVSLGRRELALFIFTRQSGADFALLRLYHAKVRRIQAAARVGT